MTDKFIRPYGFHMTGNIDMHLLVITFFLNRGVYQKTGHFFGMATICLMQSDISHSHRVDQAVDCGLWDVVPLLFNGCAKLLYIDGNCCTCQSRASQTCAMGEMSGEYAGHERTGTFSASRNCVQILATWDCALSG